MLRRTLALLMMLTPLASAEPRSPSWGAEQIEADRARALTRGKNRDVVVAVIDTGADVQHSDLRAALWTNTGEIPGNRIDDDGNGFIDDVHGWNFTARDSDLTDHVGHGTHIAGIIGARGGRGAKGVAPNAKLMILKYTDPEMKNVDSIRTTVEAIRYAVRMGAEVINYSAGGKIPSEAEREAIRSAIESGVVVIAAAGNEGRNSDEDPYYPADYGLTGLVSVTALGTNTQMLASANYGKKSVQIAAPGEKILSTIPKGRLGLMTGTSQATAFVSGVAALFLGKQYGRMAPQTTASILGLTGDLHEDFRTLHQTSVNAYRALVMHDASTSATGLATRAVELDPRLTRPEF